MFSKDPEVVEIKNVNNFKDQAVKLDHGKMRISIVPMQIINDISEVREYGIKKYKDADNWKHVEKERYINAAFRHFAEYMKDTNSKDPESGIEHIKHLACNIAFLCQMEKGE